MGNQTMLLVLLLLMMSRVTNAVSGPLYPFGAGDTMSSRSDDGSSPLIPLSRPFVYFGNAYHQIYVNHNGHLTFNQAWSSNTPYRFPAHSTIDLIAPFWTDLDNRGNGNIFYQQYISGSVLQQATQDINQYFPNLGFSANLVFIATWDRVAYFPNSGTETTFQVVLIAGVQSSFVLMNYGQIALAQRSIQAGYDTINSIHHFSIPGSFQSNFTMFSSTSNVNVAGRWAFRTDHGSRGCTFNGSPVQLGDSFWSDNSCRQRCSCTSTGIQCQSQPCSFSQICQPDAFRFSCQTIERSTCTVSGDPHYYTFDGSVFHFQGTCTYVLSEECGHGLPYYRVEGKNENRGSTQVSWTRLVRVSVYDVEIELVKGHQAEAKVNGSFASTPFSLRNGTIQVYQSGFSLAVSTDFGLLVMYDANHYVRISVPFNYFNATCGLCGTFNGHREDDFRSRTGQILTSDVDFANSWQASGDNDPACERVQCAGLDCAFCTPSQRSLYGNTAHCGILQDPSGPFAPCHVQLPPQTYEESCVYDLCVGGGYQPILCQSLNVYATQCQQHGIQPGLWRRQGFCEISCPANSHFESQGTSCPATCSNLNASHGCPLPSQESCICNLGYVLSAGVCVPLAQCGCTFENRYYSSGATVILDQNCGRRCICSRGSMACYSHGCGELEACSVEDGERGCRPTSYATCWVEGPRSYRTFDGVTFQYPGACGLILARVMGWSPHTHFVVSAEKVPRGQQGLTQMLKFEAVGTQVHIEMGGGSRVQVNGQLMRLPFSTESGHIQVFHSSVNSIVIHTSFDVTVQIDWPHLVRVTTPGTYNSSLSGLCGNYNGHRHDDFRTPNGVLVNNSQLFGDSWRDGSLSAHCVETENRVLPQIGQNTTVYYSDQSCGLMALPGGPFSLCQSRMGPQDRVEECVEDLTEAGGAPGVLCEALRGYALMCQQSGITVGNWRDVTDCEQTCPPNSHYELCGTSCPASCPSLSFPFLCVTACQEGCQCNDGYLLSANQCVPPVACGCHHQGRYLQGGERFWEGGECQSLCTCNGTTGAVRCTPYACNPQESCRVVEGEYGCHPNPHGTCSASGDPHYLTFDGGAFDFQGTCRYVLATLCGNTTRGLHHFLVEARNEPWNGLTVSITAEVFVNVWGHWVHISRERHGVVQIDGVTSNLPILLHGGRVSIYASGLRTFVNSDFGLRVSYDGSSVVSISVPSNYSGMTCGLCGNFNGNRNDDFLTPSGTLASTPSQFGNSWKVEGNYTCSDGCGASCPQCHNPSPARARCEVIKDVEGPLSFCHGQVDPEPYFRDCVFDVCLSGNREQDVLCRAIQTYVSTCQSTNVRIYPWRQNTTCNIECPANSHYELCGSDCGHTCVSSIDASCEQSCTEGCFCDNGYLRSGRHCVPVESCGCQYDGFYYDVSESFWTQGCSRHCECYASNDLRCSAASCTPNQECAIKNGRLGCFNALSTCTVWGDPHYITFDGAVAHFQGTCSYDIARTCSNHSINGLTFRVVATNRHRGNNLVSFVSLVDVWLSHGGEETHVSIGQSKSVMVDGSEVSIPSSIGSIAGVVWERGFVMLNSSDLTVQFDGRSTLMVRLGRSHHGAVCGMCGNLNGDPEDDKVLPNGTPARSDNDFGDGWKADTSRPGCGASDNRGGGDDCPFSVEYTDLCSIITNTTGPFSACHLHSDPQPYFTSCVYDLCLYTPANGMLCSAVAAYEESCSVLGLDIPEWRAVMLCAESDPCDDLDCTDDEWCGDQDGVYGCFCDENHHRPNNESYDSVTSCSSSSGIMSLSRCQLFEAGFPPHALHLTDSTCNGSVRDGRLEFHFDNDNQLCGTSLMSNGTHFIYQNYIQGEVEPHGGVMGVISRAKHLNLRFCCEYPLYQSLSMTMDLKPLESIVTRKLPSGKGHYQMRMIPYQDAGFRYPLSGSHINVEIDQQIYVAVQVDGVDSHQISTVLDSCWATPVNDPNYAVHWNLIAGECPNPEDSTVELIQNGVSTSAHFSFRMFTFTRNSSSVFLHCQVHLCLLHLNNCTTHCYPGHHHRGRRDVSFHDSAAISMGPLVLNGKDRDMWIPISERVSGAPGQIGSLVTLLLSVLLSVTTLI
ncbi:alpha-tectorin isoform X1 [Oncorhynchus tshawytscha]|uniref:alpha-tectorin isoform X1 n=1 Tax=Oncorhynchus tshawytscha TaxID=74940 RepID=UPI001C3DE5EC|nr:alpha-tectorin isoform X1 [Oncorhynchus tshawytscha]